MHTVSVPNLTEIIQSQLKPGYKVSIMHSPVSDAVDIRIYDSVKYYMYSISQRMIYSNNTVDNLLDQLSMSFTDAFLWGPRYERNFDRLMKQILNGEVVKGQLI